MAEWLKRAAPRPRGPAVACLMVFFRVVDHYTNIPRYTFTTSNVRIPGGPSLDLVMVENYVDSLAKNANLGGVGSPGMDGTFSKWPLTWEPIVNCPGGWLVAGANVYDIEEKALVAYGLSWLSSVLANLHLQLAFVLFAWDEIIANKTLGTHERILEDGVGRYGRVVKQVSEYLFTPPSGLVEPRVRVVSETKSPALVYEGGGQKCKQCARLWRRGDVVSAGDDVDHAAPISLPRSDRPLCVLLVVVNTLNVTATVVLQLERVEEWPGAFDMSLRRVDEGRSPAGKLVFRGGMGNLVLSPFETQVYRTDSSGCVSPANAGKRESVARSRPSEEVPKEEDVVWM